jgi:hypothetical protein
MVEIPIVQSALMKLPGTESVEFRSLEYVIVRTSASTAVLIEALKRNGISAYDPALLRWTGGGCPVFRQPEKAKSPIPVIDKNS